MQLIKSFLTQKIQTTYLKIIATEGLDFCDIEMRLREYYNNLGFIGDEFNGKSIQTGHGNEWKKPAKSLQSLIARREIYRQFGQFPEFDIDGKPIWKKGVYFSLSHSGQWVLVGTSSFEKIGVDIEIMKSRGKEVFNIHSNKEYEMLRSLNKNGSELEVFYRLWTIKESVLKLYLSGIDYLNDIVFSEMGVIGLDSFQEGGGVTDTTSKSLYFPIEFSKSGKFQQASFDVLVSGTFQGKKFVCFSGINSSNSLAFSLAFGRME